MKAIIPTGGRGTRMRPLTFSSNKHFIPVANKPLVFYPIETVADAGLKEVLITYNPYFPGSLDETKKILGDGSRWGLVFKYVLQDNPTGGLANIFQVCEKQLKGDSFVFHLGDNIFAEGIKEQVKYFQDKKPNALVTILKHPENTRLGVPFFDKNGKLAKYVEKPENPPNNFGIPGLYFFDHYVFGCFNGKDAIKPSSRGELEIGSAYNWMIDHKFKVEVVEYQGKWLDPGKFNDWIEANQYILDSTLESFIDESAKIDEDSNLENRVRVGKGCKITKSHIRGPVTIGDNVEINDSYIGPYTSLADGCKIDASHLENSVLMKGVKIDHVNHPIDTSLIGTETEIVHNGGPTPNFRFFIGEKCKVEV